MPKVGIKKQTGAYVPGQLRAYIRYKGITQYVLADWWKCSQPGVNYKLKNGIVNVSELAILFDRTEAEPEEIMKVLKL